MSISIYSVHQDSGPLRMGMGVGVERSLVRSLQYYGLLSEADLFVLLRSLQLQYMLKATDLGIFDPI